MDQKLGEMASVKRIESLHFFTKPRHFLGNLGGLNLDHLILLRTKICHRPLKIPPFCSGKISDSDLVIGHLWLPRISLL